MNAADEERLNTWICEIVDAIVEGVQWRQEGDERRALGQGGLSVNTRTGAWYHHSAGKGGWSAISLIKLLKSCGYKEASAWGDAWLKSHPGTGAVITNGDDAAIESAAIAQEILDKLAEPAGTQAISYARSRGIEIEDFSKLPVKFLQFARAGESAIAGILTSHDRVVGVQLGYIDAHGQKSLVSPVRRRFNLEKAPDAVFALPAPAGITDVLADTIICEGLEDLLSVAGMNRPWNLIGLPGIGTMQHLSVKNGERVVVIRDGDEPGSPADKALTAGVDHLIFEGAAVRVTETPLGEDANSILQCDGLAGLTALIGTANKLAELSDDGEITRLSQLDRLDYERQRKEQAAKLGIRVGALDAEVQRRRGGHGGEGDTVDEPVGQGRRVVIPVVDPWPNSVDGCGLLDAITTGIRDCLVLEPHRADAVALFVVFTHAFDAFETAPKLYVKSAQKRSGKTRQLEVLSRLVAKPISAAGITASALRRMIERHTPTLLLDEFDTMLKGNPEMAEALRGILNSGFNRASANMIISVPIPGGGWEERMFSTWCPQVLSGIGAIPDTVADRCLTIEMKRKLRTEPVKRLRGADGDDLRILARKAARWAEDHKIELAAADPPTPSQLDDRAADAWAPLLAIADAASPAWGKRARTAALLLSGGKEVDTPETELLADIRILFGGDGKPVQALSSDQIVAGLIQLEGHPWAEINRGLPLTKNGLARRLKPFHISPGTIQLGSGRGALTAKGYKLESFRDAFDRYLSPYHPPFSDDSTVKLSDTAENKGFWADSEPSDGGMSDGLKNAETPSNPAVSDGLTAENTEIEEGAEKGAYPEAQPASNGDARPNGHGESPAAATRYQRRLTRLDREIMAYDEAHPDLSLDHLAKTEIAELLGRMPP